MTSLIMAAKETSNRFMVHYGLAVVPHIEGEKYLHVVGNLQYRPLTHLVIQWYLTCHLYYFTVLLTTLHLLIRAVNIKAVTCYG